MCDICDRCKVKINLGDDRVDTSLYRYHLVYYEDIEIKSGGGSDYENKHTSPMVVE